MAEKKTETKTLERTYTIPLRKEFNKVPIYQRTPKAVRAVRQFLQKHMKSDVIILGKLLNEELWKHGIKNPPARVKVTVVKDEKNVVKAELFGQALEEKVRKEEHKGSKEEVKEESGKILKEKKGSKKKEKGNKEEKESIKEEATKAEEQATQAEETTKSEEKSAEKERPEEKPVD